MPFVADDSSTLTQPPMGIITGESGVGKSFAGVTAFPDYTHISTSRTQLAPFEDWIAKHAARASELKLTLPRKRLRLLLNYDAESGAVGKEVYQEVLNFIARLDQQCCAGRPPRGLIIDEWSAILEAVHAAARAIRGNSGKGPFQAIDDVKNVHAYLLGVAENHRLGLVLVHHWRDIEFVSQRDAELGGDRKGDVKYPAGPQFPLGTMIRPGVRPLDFVWQIVKRSDERVLLTHPAENIVRKTRRFGATSEKQDDLPDEIELTREKDLRYWARAIGFNP